MVPPLSAVQPYHQTERITHMDYSLELRGSSLCIIAHGDILISDITGYLKHDGHDYNVITVPRVGEWSITEDGDAVCDNMTLELSPCREGFLVRSTFTNTEGDIDVPCEFTAFAGHLHRTIERAVINRWHEANGNKVNEMQSQIDTVRTVFNAVYDSAENTAFDTAEGDAFIFGQASYEKYFSGVTITREGFITAHASTEWHRIKTGDTVTSEAFYFAPAGDVVSGLEEFADCVAEIAGAVPITRENPSGFCTWYYYAGKITPDTLRQNMAVLDEHKCDIPVKYIQIDDGWYDCWGSWQNNDKFPDMRSLADEIKSHGYLPGIWLAPFGCHGGAALFGEHPEYFVQFRDGGAWRELSLDYTNPDVRKYMGAVFHRLSYEWGFRYIKMDIISGTLAPGVHYDSAATALENYRLALRTFRENVTEDTFLLACTAPLGPACGLVDGMRVSCDVFERWESLLSVFNAVLKRWYYHRRYFLCDADCLIIRKAENEDSECWRLCTRTDNEIRTYVTAMAASGGILMLSDKLPNLSEDQLKLISKLFPVNQRAARPLDLAESYIPGVLDFGVRRGCRTVALINWGDAPRTMSVENDSALVWEFWDERFFVHHGGNFELTVAPRSAAVLRFTPMPDGGCAAIIGSDASVVSEIDWHCEGNRTLAGRTKADERVFAAAREGICALRGCEVYTLGSDGTYTVCELRPSEDEYEITTMTK